VKTKMGGKSKELLLDKRKVMVNLKAVEYKLSDISRMLSVPADQ
jgi:hypothetical protein